MINAYLFSPDQETEAGGKELLERWREQPQSMLWLDIESAEMSNKSLTAFLTEMGCHSLAISDALRERHPPKIELFSDHFFLLYRGIWESVSHTQFHHQQLAFFIGERYLITVHPQRSAGIEKVLSGGVDQLTKHTPMSLALMIIHGSAGVYLEQILSFEDELTDVEESLYGDRSEDSLLDLASYKANLIKLKRVFNYHDAIFKQFKQFPAEDLPFDCSRYEHRINDVAERLERLLSLSQMYYDICSDMIDSYISITSHQLNITMRLLTVVTVVFVPLTFLAGIYGMNFEYIPELRFKYGYFVALGIMLGMAITMVVLFRRKKWF